MRFWNPWSVRICSCATARRLPLSADDPGYQGVPYQGSVGTDRLGEAFFAKPEYMEKFLDITPGSVSVLGLMNDKEHQVKLLIDEEVLDSEYFGCHPCINTSSLRMRTADPDRKGASRHGT